MFVAFYHNWIILAFLGPLFWTVSDFIDKFILEKHKVGIWDFLFFFSLFSWVCLGLLVWVYGVPPLSEQSIFAVLLGFATTASFYLYARGLMVLDTSQAILTFKLVPITVIFLAFALFGDPILGHEILAAFVVLAGAAFLFVSFDAGKFRISAGILWMFAAVGSWASIFVFADKILDQMPFEHYMVFDTFGASLFAIAVPFLPKARLEIRGALRDLGPIKLTWFFANTLTDFIAQVCLKKAFSLSTSAGLVSIITQVQSIYGIIAGLALTLIFPATFHENISIRTLMRKLIGTLVMIGGIYIAFFGI